MTSIGPYAASGPGRPSLARILAQSRDRLEELAAQLGTGKVSQTYAGLGDGAATSLAMRAKLSQIGSYQATNATVSMRVSLMSRSIERLDGIASEYKTVDPNEFLLTSGSVTIAQSQAAIDLKEAIAALNLEVGGRYLFSGRSTDVKPVISAEAMLADDGGKAGLRTFIEERKLADLGADGRGRIDVSALNGSTFDVGEQASGPFGFKLKSVSTTLQNGVASGPAGAPASITLGLTGQPQACGEIRVGLELPDGSMEEVALVAKAADDPTALGPGEFRIGADAAQTSANMRAAFDDALKSRASTDLVAASAMQAGEAFFNVPAGGEPARVAGFDGAYASEAERVAALQSATALDTTGTAAKSVSWYVGDDGAGNPRNTAAAKIDDGVSVGYGARADEDGPRQALQSLAVFSTMTFSADDPQAKARYAALAERTTRTLGSPAAAGAIESIAVDLASVATAVKSAGERQGVAKKMAEDALSSIEDVSREDVSVKILSLQAQLQASYQITANLSQLTLVNYL